MAKLSEDVYEPYKNQIRAVSGVNVPNTPAAMPVIAPMATTGMGESMIKKANLNKRPDGSSKQSKVNKIN